MDVTKKSFTNNAGKHAKFVENALTRKAQNSAKKKRKLDNVRKRSVIPIVQIHVDTVVVNCIFV